MYIEMIKQAIAMFTFYFPDSVYGDAINGSLKWYCFKIFHFYTPSFSAPLHLIQCQKYVQC